MSPDILMYLAAFGGGFFGAAIGALGAFAFTGIVLLVGIAALIGSGDATIIGLAFGSYFGPHVSFAGGAAAAAFARRQGWLENGRDIVTPLASLGKPVVLIVGGVFGVAGMIVQQAVLLIPWFASHTDAVALTVVISALAARLIFGKTGVVGKGPEGLTGMAKLAPTDQFNWVRYQEKWGQAATLGLGAGLIAAYASVTLTQAMATLYPDAAAGQFTSVIYIGFGVSAASLLFMNCGLDVPVTHHMTIIGAVGAFAFLPVVGPIWAVVIGTVFAIIAALGGEFFSRFWLIRGDSHIDPPASIIWVMTTVVWLCALIAGAPGAA